MERCSDKNTFDGREAKFIQKIITEISLKLHVINRSIDEDLVGIESRLENVISFLEVESEDDVRMIGIWGMGGAGKTTLARAVFDNISIWFEGSSFVQNVRESSKGKGLKELQKQVLKDVLNDQSIDVTSVSDGVNKMKQLMPHRKVLVVLDDVDGIDQLEALARKPSWFKPGSRIIITTRDKQLLIAHGVHVDNIYKIGLLSDDEAICLFNRHAFRSKFPIQGYEELSKKVVHYAAGLPLTIKVLGSLLCGRTEPIWLDTLKRLKTIPLKETLKILEISYDSLEEDQKEIFLDVACILKGERKNKAIRILESCGFHAQIGLEVLEQKSLINISSYGCLGMHDHIEEMGRNIVRRLHPCEPNRHSRLWVKEEIEEILVNDLGTEDTKSMILKYTNIHPAIVMKSLRKMKKIIFLSVYYFVFSKNWKIDEGDVQYLPDTLQCLFWDEYPFYCLPKTFQANDLIYLKMHGSCISQLWEIGERKVLKKLKFVDLSYSKLRTFDLGMTRNLETLNLRSCKDLVEFRIPIPLPMLKDLNLSGSKVSNLNLGMATNIMTLSLKGCEDLVELQMSVALPMLEDLDLSGSKVSNLNLGMTPNIKTLSLKGCEDLVELQMSVALPMLEDLDLSGSKVSNLNLGMTPNLKFLELMDCYYLQEIHAPVGCLKNLTHLNLSGCLRFEYFWFETPPVDSLANLELNAESLDRCPLHPNSNLPKFKFECKYGEVLPSSSGNVEKLLSFGLCACTNLESFSASICGLKHLTTLTLLGSIPELPKDLWKLESLEQLTLCMQEIKHLPDNICMLKHLKSLDLAGCKDLVELQMSVALPMLEDLDLSGSKVSNLNLGMTPNIKTLSLKGCEDLVELQMSVALPMLKDLDLSGSKVSNLNLRMTPNIKTLSLKGCEDLVELQMSVALPMLKDLDLSGSKVSNLNLGMTPNLKFLKLMDCYYLQEIHAPVGCLKNLAYLYLSGCWRFEYFWFETPRMDSLANLELNAESLDRCPLHPNSNLPKFKFECKYGEVLPSSSGNVEKLLSFGLCACTNLESFSVSICSLKHLTALKLSGSIPELPKDLWKLGSLEKLTLCMDKIKHLPDNICMLKHLKYLELRSCRLLEQLPMDLGGLECLEELRLTDCTSLRDLPDNIWCLITVTY
ncbi:hypothetical protein R6Q59_016492 [Mikania micrantha]